MTDTYCEPFCIKDGYNFEIHHVRYDEGDDYSCFMHFHEVHEIIFFEQIEGSYYYHQGQSSLEAGDVVFTPAMETHDFELSEKPKSWFIIQFPAKLFELDELKQEAVFFQTGMHLRVVPEQIEKLRHLVTWLFDSFSTNPMSNQSIALLKLLLVLLAENAKPLRSNQQQALSASPHFEKLKPLIDRFRRDLAVNLSLGEAAAMCHLSPSYFSRLFKQVFRYPYSEYSLRHKLYSAARLLSQSNASITEISYELNFSSPSHFIALYKKQFGCTPKQYRTDIQRRARTQ